MSFGAFSTYDYYTMSAEEKALLENVEALTSEETLGFKVTSCLGLFNESKGTNPLIIVKKLIS